MVWMYGIRPSTPSLTIARGVLATGNSLRVARLTPRSVAWAESTTATSSSNGELYSSSDLGSGLASRRRAKIARRFSGFIDAPCAHRRRRRLVAVAACGARVRVLSLPPRALFSHWLQARAELRAGRVGAARQPISPGAAPRSRCDRARGGACVHESARARHAHRLLTRRASARPESWRYSPWDTAAYIDRTRYKGRRARYACASRYPRSRRPDTPGCTACNQCTALHRSPQP